MVTPIDAENRGQIVLVGSLVIAFIIVGMAMLFTSVGYTEQASERARVDSLQEVSQFSYEAKRGTRSLIFRLNHRYNYTTESALESWIQSNVTNYSSALGTSFAPQGVYVNVSTNESTITWGQKLVQPGDANFTNASGNETWTVVDNEDAIGWFFLNFNVTDMDEDFRIVVTGANETVEYSFNRTPNGSVGIEWTGTAGVSGATKCDQARGRGLINVLDGSSATDNCTFYSFRAIDGPYTIEFENGMNATGRFSIVVEDETSLTSGTCPPAASGDPCYGPVVWSINATIRYYGATDQVTYRKTQPIPIYNSTGS